MTDEKPKLPRGRPRKPGAKPKGTHKYATIPPEIRTPRDRGRPKHVPNATSRGLVRMLVILRRTHEEIAAAGGLDPKTLRRHYREDLDRAYDQTGAQLMQTALMVALGGAGPSARWQDANISMLIFLLKTRFGFKPPAQEHMIGHYDLSKLSDEQLAS